MPSDAALSTSPNAESHFDRSAWLALAIGAVLLAYGVAVLAYRFTLPTDGWAVDASSTPAHFIYLDNLMGAESGLRPGDHVVAVEGIGYGDVATSPELQSAWRAGETLPYSVVRDGQAQQVLVTLVHWQFGRWLLGLLTRPLDLANLLTSYGLLALAGLVFWRRPGNPAARGFFVLNAALEAVTLVTGRLPVAWPEEADRVARVFTNDVANGVYYGLLLPVVFIHFALVFPHPKPILQRRPWLSYFPLAVGLIIVVLGQDSPLPWFWFVLSVFVMLAILAHNAVTMRDAVSRAQIMWGLGGLMIGFGLFGLLLLGGTLGWLQGVGTGLSDLVVSVASTVIGVTLSIAITRYRLFDIDVIVRRTLIYSLLTALLALAYFGSVVVLERVFRFATGQGQNTLVVVLSTLTIAALFGPLRARVQLAIDRRFYRRKYDAARTLASFGARARDEVALDALQAQLEEVVGETFQPKSVSVWWAGVGKGRQSIRHDK